LGIVVSGPREARFQGWSGPTAWAGHGAPGATAWPRRQCFGSLPSTRGQRRALGWSPTKLTGPPRGLASVSLGGRGMGEATPEAVVWAMVAKTTK